MFESNSVFNYCFRAMNIGDMQIQGGQRDGGGGGWCAPFFSPMSKSLFIYVIDLSQHRGTSPSSSLSHLFLPLVLLNVAIFVHSGEKNDCQTRNSCMLLHSQL